MQNYRGVRLIQFQCKRCKDLFSIDNLSDQDISVKSSDVNDLEALSKIIEQVANRTRCPKCDSSVYLKSLAGINFDYPVDVTSKPIVQNIKRLVDLHSEYKRNTLTADSFIKYSQEAENITYEIVNNLIWNPGGLIFIEDTDLINDALTVVNEIWRSTSLDELWEEISAGGYRGLMVNILSDYIERAKYLRPVFVSVKPTAEVNLYFHEAMKSWLFGMDAAALILCCAIMEEFLGKKYPKLTPHERTKITKKGKGKKGDLEALIDKAKKEHLFDDTDFTKATKVRILRNDAIHKRKRIETNDTYDAIVNTVSIVEKLLLQ